MRNRGFHGFGSWFELRPVAIGRENPAPKSSATLAVFRTFWEHCPTGRESLSDYSVVEFFHVVFSELNFLQDILISQEESLLYWNIVSRRFKSICISIQSMLYAIPPPMLFETITCILCCRYGIFISTTDLNRSATIYLLFLGVLMYGNHRI